MTINQSSSFKPESFTFQSSFLPIDITTQSETNLLDLIESAVTNKQAFLQLLLESRQEGEYDDFGDSHTPWIRDIVASNKWDEMNLDFWKNFWDGNVDSLIDTVHSCYSKYYPYQ